MFHVTTDRERISLSHLLPAEVVLQLYAKVLSFVTPTPPSPMGGQNYIFVGK